MVLSHGDDYPVHQTADPIAHAGTDRNFYDRYFFSLLSPDGALYAATAMGVYPQLGIADAAVSVVLDGSVQHNLRASRHMGIERMDTRVGPIEVEVLEPLQRLAVRVQDNPHGLRAEMIFEGRAAPIEEPRFTYRQGTRTVMDYTRMTQAGRWSGWIEFEGRRFDLDPDSWRGVRDRSWGVREFAGPGQQRNPAQSGQFCWFWSPLNFDDYAVFWHTNEDALGDAFNRSGVIVELASGRATHFPLSRYRIDFEPGTRHAHAFHVEMTTADGRQARIYFQPKFNFLMPGIGYRHSTWRHGTDKGPSALGFDSYVLSEIDRGTLEYGHIQAICDVTLSWQGRDLAGKGALEQLIAGPHSPSGFTELFDTAK